MAWVLLDRTGQGLVSGSLEAVRRRAVKVAGPWSALGLAYLRRKTRR